MGGDLENIPWRESFTLGDGIMSDGSIGPSPFDGLTAEAQAFPSWDKAPQGKLSVSIAIVSDSDSYSDVVDASIEASAEFNGGFGSGGGGVEASYLSSTCADTSAVHLTVNSSYLGDARTFEEGTELKLSEAAKEMLKTEGPSAFEQAYGRYYIHGMKRGAWYHGVTSIKARDASHKRDIKAALNVKYDGAAVSAQAKASVQAAVENASKDAETNSTEAASGWNTSEDFSGQSVEAMIDKANRLLDKTEGSPILAILKPYAAVADYAAALDNSLVIDLGKSARNQLRSQLMSQDYLDKAMNSMLDDDAVGRDAKRAIRELKKPLIAAKIGLEETDWAHYANVHSFNNWLTSARDVDGDRWEPLFAADWIGERWEDLIQAIGNGKPGNTEVIGTRNGQNSYEFDHGLHQRMSYIQITTGSVAVSGITVKYTDNNRTMLVDVGDTSRCKVIPGAFTYVVYTFAPDEFITELTVWTDGGRGVVRNLAFATNKGAALGPCPSCTLGTPATVRVPPGAVTCGLFGSWAWLPDSYRAAPASNPIIVPESIGLRYRMPWTLPPQAAGAAGAPPPAAAVGPGTGRRQDSMAAHV